MFVIPAPHEPIIDEETFDCVQARLAAANVGPVRSKLQRPDPIGAGLFRCNQCGGRMTFARRSVDADIRAASYACLSHISGTTICGGMFTSGPAHAALLEQIKRLRFLRWDLSRASSPVDAAPDPRVDLQRALDQAREKMRRHVRRFTDLIEDPSPLETLEHRAYGRELSEKITSLETALKALPATRPIVLDLRLLHEQFARTDLASIVDKLVEQGDELALRDLALALVESAVVVERLPERRSTWLRVAVTWSADIRALLDADQIELAPDVERHVSPVTAAELARARNKRYQLRKKAGLTGTT
jgi:hypothetical protein